MVPFVSQPAIDGTVCTDLPAFRVQVEHFSIKQVVQTEGCYSRGHVTVNALPEGVYGVGNRHTWPLRRIQVHAKPGSLH